MAPLVLYPDHEPPSGVFVIPGVFPSSTLTKGVPRLVQRPGLRGGRWYYTRGGKVRYGWPPRRVIPDHGPIHTVVDRHTWSRERMKALYRDINQWPDTHDPKFEWKDFSPRDVAQMAYNSIRRGRYVGVIERAARNVAIYSLDLTAEDGDEAGTGMPPGQYLQLYALATRERGNGRIAMWHAMEEVERRGCGLVLLSAPNANEFYRHLGMHPFESDPDWYYFSPEEVVEWRKKNRPTH